MSRLTMDRGSPLPDSTKAKSVVYHLLKYRPRSEAEVTNKLKEKGIPCEVITEILDYFRRLKLIDDHNFAKGWIRSRLRKPIGILRIRRELREKGIAQDIIDQQLSLEIPEHDQDEAIRDLVRRRLRQYQKLEPLKRKKRLYDYLLRKGFTPDTVIRTLRGLGENNADQ